MAVEGDGKTRRCLVLTGRSARRKRAGLDGGRARRDARELHAERRGPLRRGHGTRHRPMASPGERAKAWRSRKRSQRSPHFCTMAGTAGFRGRRTAVTACQRWRRLCRKRAVKKGVRSPRRVGPGTNDGWRRAPARCRRRMRGSSIESARRASGGDDAWGECRQHQSRSPPLVAFSVSCRRRPAGRTVERVQRGGERERRKPCCTGSGPADAGAGASEVPRLASFPLCRRRMNESVPLPETSVTAR